MLIQALADQANSTKAPKDIRAFEEATGRDPPRPQTPTEDFLLTGVVASGEVTGSPISALQDLIIEAEALLHDEVIPLVRAARDDSALTSMRELAADLAELRQLALGLTPAVLIPNTLIEAEPLEQLHAKLKKGFGQVQVLARDRHIATGGVPEPDGLGSSSTDCPEEVWRSARWIRFATNDGLMPATLRSRWKGGKGPIRGQKQRGRLQFEVESVCTVYPEFANSLRQGLKEIDPRDLRPRRRAKAHQSASTNIKGKKSR